MKKATVTYVAPLGDSKVVEMGGMTFFDGKSQEINSYDNAAVFEKLKTNPHFDFVLGAETKDNEVKPPVKRGRPSNLDKAAAAKAAEDADREAKEAAEKAKEAKADLEAINKEEKPAVKTATPVPQPQPVHTPPTPSPAVT